ncbi:MAG: hypothetical protein LBQ43_04805 [Holosporales bacterium]|nr:hypothetical protein [Holosporales bacterium]
MNDNNKLKTNISSDLLYYIPLVITTFFAFMCFFRTWNWNFSAPISLYGDEFYPYALSKIILKTGWWWSDPSLSFPYGYYPLAYPAPGHLDYVLLKIASFFTDNCFAVASIEVMISNILTVVFAFFCIRLFDVSRLTAFVFSILYAFLPALYYNHISHMQVLFHAIPPLAASAALILSDRLRKLSKPRLIILNVLVFICAFSYVYTVFFAAFCFFVAIIFGSIRSAEPKKQILSGCLLLAIMLGGFLINLAPTFYLWHKYPGAENMMRHPAEADYYGLRIRDLLTPVDINPRSMLRRVSRKVSAADYPLSTENMAAKLGTLFSLGFLLLFINLFSMGRIGFGQKQEPPYITSFALLVTACVLWSTIGGFGSIFNLLISPSVRALNRISLYIAFYCAATMAVIFSHLESKFTKAKRSKCIWSFCMVSLLVYGLYDQRVWKKLPDYSKDDSLTYTREILDKVQETLPNGTNFLYMPFCSITSLLPSAVEAGLYFGELLPYLLSDGYNWSTFAVLPEAKKNLNIICALDGSELIYYAKKFRFDAVWVDKRGYKDRGGLLLNSIASVNGTTKICENDLFSVIDIRDVDFKDIDNNKIDLGQNVSGLYIDYGFSTPETSSSFQAGKAYRWSDGNEAALTFYADNVEDEAITARFDVFPFLCGEILKKQRVEIFINDKKVDSWVLTEPEVKTLNFMAPESGGAPLKLKFQFLDAMEPGALGINDDWRKLAVGFHAIHFNRSVYPH